MKFNKKIKENTGNLVRVGSALGAIGKALYWYNDVKDYVLNEIIDDIATDLTNSIDWCFGVYGVGEGINVVKQFREDKKTGNKPNFLEYPGRIARVAPIVAPFISYATDGDFFKSILIPATICVGGYGLEYVGSLFRKNSANKKQAQP